MAAICLQLRIHQPFRLRNYTVFDTRPQYWDDGGTRREMKREAEETYLPLLETLKDLIERHEGRFRVALSISGTAMEQLAVESPTTVEALQGLAGSNAGGAVEFLGETYFHSLASLVGGTEFEEQVALHRQAMKRVLGVTPRIFCNTGLMADEAIAGRVAGCGFEGMLMDGEGVPAARSAAFVYRASESVAAQRLAGRVRAEDQEEVAEGFFYLLRHHAGSVAFPEGGSNAGMTAGKFAAMVEGVGGPFCHVFVGDAALLKGWETGTLSRFLRELPGELTRHGVVGMLPSEVVEAGRESIAGELVLERTVSEVGPGHDMSAWQGNAMQRDALAKLFALEGAVKRAKDPAVLRDWRLLTAADHFAAMSTGPMGAGVARRGSGFESPYDAYISFMNVLENLGSRVK